MSRWLVAITTFVFSSAGWYVGAFAGIFGAFVLSVVGTGVGIYVGKQLAERWGG